jgi:dienelactone hydrolase
VHRTIFETRKFCIRCFAPRRATAIVARLQSELLPGESRGSTPPAPAATELENRGSAVLRKSVLMTAPLLLLSTCFAPAGAVPPKDLLPLDSLITEPLRIPAPQAEPSGLQALLIRPSGEGPFPLLVLTHGKAATDAVNRAQLPEQMLPVAKEFARRGWATLIVMRRGYGTSGGRFAENMISCEYPDYLHVAREAARDLRSAIIYMSQQPHIDRTRIIAVGASQGGAAVVALTANPPPGLVAAINFAGVMGHVAPDTVCQPGSLLSTFWILGKTSRIPMLWVYTENDHFIPLSLAQRCYDEFATAGGQATFMASPPFGTEDHYLFTRNGTRLWLGYVNQFLESHALQ